MCFSHVQFFVVKEVSEKQAVLHEFEALGSTFKPEGDMLVSHTSPSSHTHTHAHTYTHTHLLSPACWVVRGWWVKIMLTVSQNLSMCVSSVMTLGWLSTRFVCVCVCVCVRVRARARVCELVPQTDLSLSLPPSLSFRRSRCMRRLGSQQRWL